MDILKKTPGTKPFAAMIAAAAVAAPAVAEGKAVEPKGDGKPSKAAQAKTPYEKAYERDYIKVRRKVVKRFDAETAGRNIVRDGYRTNDGDVREARKGEVVESTELMSSWLQPAQSAEPAPAETAKSTATGTTSYETSGAPTSVIECESGGDYGAVNPAGYYGAYQFDQQTWDAYAPSGYAGTNPAQAPPEVQDAAAASVPYDAWPNC